MARIRTVKPEVARHRLLFDLERELGVNVRFAWVLMPGMCDREGRFRWRPWDLKLDVLPYDECDFSRVLDAWLTRGLLVRYRVGDEWYGLIPTFRRHQAVNPRESASSLPDIKEADEVQDYRSHTLADASGTRDSRVIDASRTRQHLAHGEGKGREGKGRGREWNDASLMDLTAALRTAYPPGTYRESNWMLAEREVGRLIDDGTATPDALLALTLAFRAQMDAKGSTGTQFVLSPEKFFGADGHWRGPFPLPLAKAEQRQEANIAAGREFLAGGGSG